MWPTRGARRASNELAKNGSDAARLRAENAELVDQLRNANRTLARLQAESLAEGSSPDGRQQADAGDIDAGLGVRSGGFRERTAEDWARMAERGAILVRTPCLSPRLYHPTTENLDRLALAPTDGPMISEIYERSRKRLTVVVQPMCTSLLGGAEAADRVGPKACIRAILASARRTDAEGTSKAIVRVAKSNASGVPSAAPDAPPLERLLVALTTESGALQADLAARLGPEEAKRLANAPELCVDYWNIRADESGAR